MSASISTSRLFAALTACHERLLGLVPTIPPHPDTNARPSVLFMARSEEWTAEYIDLWGKVDDDELEHTASPGAREEMFELMIQIGSVVAGNDGPAVIRRLGEISAVIEAGFRDQTTGKPILLDLGGNEVAKGGINRIEITPYPNTDRGWAATADLYLRVYARI